MIALQKYQGAWIPSGTPDENRDAISKKQLAGYLICRGGTSYATLLILTTMPAENGGIASAIHR